jgi:diguanylate cyclase (GGDEF)-like protein
MIDMPTGILSDPDDYLIYRKKISRFAPERSIDLGDELMQILNNEEIKTVFQPIVSLKDGKVHGYEALSRGPKDTMLEQPAALFDIARLHNKLWELEFLCRLKAIENASKFFPDSKIFLNVDPAIINDDKFKQGFTKEYLTRYNIDVQNIVFEITERNTIRDYRAFRKTIDNYKNQGYSIAIDDLGSGYSGLTTIAEIHPHYIKLDMNLIRNIDKDGLKFAMIKTFYEFACIADMKIVAEGIETENELSALIEIGVDFGQGYYIQQPSESLKSISADITRYIADKNREKIVPYSAASSAIVGHISRKNPFINPQALGSDVLSMFSKNPSLYALPVVDNNKVCGLIMREKFFARLGTQYGYMLHFNRPISMLMNTHPIIIDFETRVNLVSKIAITRNEEELYDYIIVVKDSLYYGVVTIKDLLEKTTQMEVNYAKHLNPLTGLPGNMLIECKLTESLSGGKPYSILYIDIDNFKVYNDVYGFEAGDKMLQTLAHIITGCVSKITRGSNFVGHIGGDDFVIVIDGYEIDELCGSIIAMFRQKLGSFYNRETLEKGYVVAKNRRGKEEHFGLATLSIACVTNNGRHFKDAVELTEYASKIKAQCKENEDSCYIIG